MSDSVNTGLFVLTSYVWDVSQLYDTEVTSPAFKELLVRLYQNLNRMSLALNVKDTGIYDIFEFVNGQQYFPNPAYSSATTTNPERRQVYRLVINFGALPNTGTKAVPHGLVPNAAWTFTRIYATASDTTGFNYIPIPYASPVLANAVELFVDAVNVNITTGSNRSNFNVCYVVLEYMKL